MIRVLYSYSQFDNYFNNEILLFENYFGSKYKIDTINHLKALNWSSDISPSELDKLYRSKDEMLFKFYSKIFELCKNYDVLYVDHECVYHPDFILELNKIIYTSYSCGDDPESSYIRSKPYLYAFNHSFCYGVMHNEKQTVVEKYIEWGANKADWRPHGYMNELKSNVSKNELFSIEKDIDLVFVGGYANPERNRFILSLKKHFGKKFHLHGRWGGFIARLSRIRNGMPGNKITSVSNKEIKNLYLRSKIGINIHQSYGPINLRMYELSANGVMQICDNEKGMSRVYNVGEEIICYKQNNIDEAMDKIKFYLDNEEQRALIANNAYEKTIKNYSFQKCLYDSLEKIRKNN